MLPYQDYQEVIDQILCSIWPLRWSCSNLFYDEHYDKEAYTRAIRALDTIQKSVDRLRPICEEHKDIKKKRDEEEKKQQEENKKSAAAQKILERVEAED